MGSRGLSLTRDSGGFRAGVLMTVRCATALVGGYAAAAGTAALMARLLPPPLVEATMWGIVLSFLLFAGFGLWAFAERRLARVTAVIWGTAALTSGVTLLLGVRP